MLDWLSTYKRVDLRSDLVAGITVGIMLIPQGMAYAMIAGVPPIYGLYASFIPLIVYSFFGTSRQLSVAPVAMISLLIAAGLSQRAQQGSDEFIQLAILLAAMVGLLQLLFGAFKLGFLVNFLSRPVIGGYTSAAAIIIGLSQLKHLLGIDMPSSNLIHEVILQTAAHIHEIQWVTLWTGLIGIALMLIMKRISKRIPGSLILVIVSIILVYVLRLDLIGMKIVGFVPRGLPEPSMITIDLHTALQLLPLALLISLVGFMESISISKAIQARHRNYEVKANRELIALGLSNMIGSLFSTFPVSGGFSRTAVNDQAGARTNMSSIFSALLIGLTLIFLTPLFFYLPKVVLAVIIIVAVAGLVDVRLGLYLWRISKRDFIMMNITFYTTLIFGVQAGIATGVVLSLALMIHRSAYPHFARLGKLPDTNYFRNLDRFKEAIDRDDALIFRFDAQLYFANIQYFKDKLYKMADKKGEKLKVIIINAQAINDLDASAVGVMEEIIEDCRKKGIEFYMTEVIGPVRDVLKRTGLLDKIGHDHFHMRIYDALDHFDHAPERDHSYATQSNVD
jgi:SulP family sulfate permease